VLSLTFQDKDSFGTDTSLFDWSSKNGTGNNRGITFLDQSNRPSTTIAPNESADLDGVDDYISGNDNSNVSPVSGITLEAWIFPKSVSSTQTIIFKGVPGGSAVNYRLRLIGSSLNAIVDGNSTATFPNSIPANVWTHAAFTYEGSSGRYFLYINGNRTGTGVITAGAITDGSDSLRIGSSGIPGNNFFGLVDEVRISNYAKTQVEIQRYLFQSIDNGNEPHSGLVNVCYNLDGYAYDNADSGPRLNFVSGAGFSHAGATDNQPVSPIDREDPMNFSDGFNLKFSGKRIPFAGITGVVIDSFDICLDTIITDINLFVGINHTAEEELEIQLVGPGGESVLVYDNQSLVSNSDNIITIFDDNADSSISNNGRYVSFAPAIRPKNNLNTIFAGKNTGGIWKLVVNDLSGSGVGRISGWGMQFNNINLKLPTICLKVFMEGFYREDDSTIVDSIKTHIIESETMEEVGVAGETPDLDNFIRYNFYEADYDLRYYLQVRHRNSIQIWSANPIAFDFLSGSIRYDFTESPDSAFGSNEVEVDDVPLRYAMYGGDVNQDDNVNLTDILAVTNDANLFTVGYVVTDVTGDNVVNLNDVLLTTNNSTNFVVAIIP
ncbi:MAG: LamG-like jellyroll fold domain-containing protein, partial [Ignavibacteria bacterium]